MTAEVARVQARRHLDAGRPAAALDALAPQLGGETVPSDVLLLASESLYALHRYEDSERLARLALSQDSEDLGAMLRLAYAQAAQRRSRWDARDTAATAIARYPHVWLVHTHAAEIALQIKYIVGAEDSAREGVRLGPNEVAAWRVLGDVLVAVSKRKEARAAYREALRLEPDDPYAAHSLILASPAASTADRARTFSGILANDPDWDIAAKNFVITLRRSLFVFNLLLVIPLVAGSTIAYAASRTADGVLLGDRVGLAAIPLVVAAGVAAWVWRFNVRTGAQGRRLLSAGLVSNRANATSVLFLAASWLSMVVAAFTDGGIPILLYVLAWLAAVSSYAVMWLIGWYRLLTRT